MGEWSPGPLPAAAGPDFRDEGGRMRYVLLISSDKAGPPPQRAEMEALLQGHKRFADELQAARKMVHGERLRPDEEASRVRLKAGRRQVRDGAFTETDGGLGACDVIVSDV